MTRQQRLARRRRELRSRVFPVPMLATAYRQSKPMIDDIGLAVPKKCVAKFNKFYADNGVSGVYHKPNGDCVVESRQARNAVLKLRNLRDNEAGYGDWAGKH